MKKITLLFLSLFSIAAFSQSINQDLLLDYHFDGNTTDASGNDYDATPFGITYGPDRLGNPNAAAYFDGIDDYVNFPNLAALKVSLPVSFSFWVKYQTEDYNSQVIFNTSMEENHATSVVFNSQSGTSKYVINYADGQYFYGASSRRSYASNATITTSEWHQIVVVVHSATNMKIYVDCVESGGTYSGTGGDLSYSIQPGCIGRHDRSLSLPIDYFRGYIDNFRYWSRALTAADADKLCNEDNQELATIPIERTEFVIYPNPASLTLHIETGGKPLTKVTLYNAIGQQIYQGESNEIDVRSFAHGVYIARIASGDCSVDKKVIIR